MERNLSRRVFLRGSVIALGSSLVAACAPQVVEVEKEVTKVVKETVVVEGQVQVVEKVVKETVIVEKVAQPTPGPTLQTIPLVFSDWPDEWAVKVHSDLINEFQEKHPNVLVSYFPQIGYDLTKLTAMMAGGVAPDVFGGWGDWLRTWAEKGQLLELDSFIELSAELDFDDLYAAQFEAMQYEGHQYALPKYVNPNTLYYNKTMFDEAGLDYPTYDWTWQDWRDAALALTKRSGDQTTQWGLHLSLGGGFSREAGFIWGNCGEFIAQDDATKFTLDSAETIEGLQFLHDLIWKDKVLALASDVGGISVPFQANMAALEVNGGNNFWYHNQNIGDRFEWEGTLLPKGKCGRGIRVSTDGFMAYSGTRFPELTWELFEMMVSADAMTRRAKEGLLPPARRSVMPAYESMLPEYNLKCVADAMEEARADARSVWAGGNATWQVIAPYYEQCFFLNRISVEEAMTKAVEEIHAKKPWQS